MELTLRQAHKLCDKIQALSKKFTVPEPTSRASVLRNVMQLAAEGSAKAEFSMSSFIELTALKFDIRTMIQHVNHECGIDHNISGRKMLIEQLTLLRSFIDQATNGYTKVDSAIPHDELSNYVAEVRSSPTPQQSEITFQTLSAAAMQGVVSRISALERQLSDVEDRLAALNVANAITLDDSQVRDLKKFGLLSQ